MPLLKRNGPTGVVTAIVSGDHVDRGHHYTELCMCVLPPRTGVRSRVGRRPDMPMCGR
jgi:hypothetical protein